MRHAALNTGPDFHLLDHIAPLAYLNQMPLFTTEEKNFELARRYYPQVHTSYKPTLGSDLKFLSEEFDVLFECKYWAPHLQLLFEKLYKKKMRLVFCPHGQSDKGFQAPLLAPYATQWMVLTYGNLLKQMLMRLGIWSSISNHAVIGNYRLLFYLKYKTFYDNLVDKLLFPHLDRKKPVLLYAPTWKDADQSFFEQGPKIILEIPSDWNLIVKVHPLLEQRDPAQFYKIAALCGKKKNVLLLHEFPLVYPLLAQSNAYLGDFSSIGYDFLFFQRPMFFLPAPYSGALHQCGQKIEPNFTLIEKNLHASTQKKLYEHAFADVSSLEKVRENIHSVLSEGSTNNVCKSFK